MAKKLTKKQQADISGAPYMDLQVEAFVALRSFFLSTGIKVARANEIAERAVSGKNNNAAQHRRIIAANKYSPS